MQWIAVHLPELSLEALAAALPADQAAQPLALLAGHRVGAPNPAARAGGVRPGQSRATALALVPTLQLAEADAHRDAAALQAVAHALLAFSPAVSVAAPHTVVLEVQSCLRYFGGLVRLVQRLRAALAPLGHRLQLACAPTALGAAVLAHWHEGFEQGAHVAQLPALRRLLDDAPLHLLPPAAAHEAGLQAMGLHTLGDLAHLPRAGLARRFGPELLLALDRARGDAPDPREPLRPAPRFAGRLELLARADTTAPLLAGAQVLLAQLVAWAQAQHGRIARFTLRMHAEASTRQRDVEGPTELTVALAEPSADTRHLQQLLAERLARLPLVAPAESLSLACDAVVPGTPPSGELFPSAAGEREGLTRLIERLQARLGREQVCRAEPVADHRPERATRWVPADEKPVALPPAPPPPAGLSRPWWLLQAPQRLPAREARPLFEGRPLTLLLGPERIESGWWDGELVTRDYFVAQAHDGALVWVYRDRMPPPPGESDGWFLQGWFG